MRRSIILLFLLLPLFTLAQKDYKLIEQSSKEKPSWLTGASTQGYYMIQANKVATIDLAQKTVLNSLMEQISYSIAVTVVSEMESAIDWTTVDLNGKTQEQYIEQLKSSTKIKVAGIPALQGISLIKADTYYERYINKKTKEECYDYYILYPFSTFDLQELIDAFNAQEKVLNEKIESYRIKLDDIDNVNVLLESINEMKTMMTEIGEDDFIKYNKLKNYVSLYEKVKKEIYIDVVENTKGVMIVQLKHGEKVMKTTCLPQFRCSCVKDIQSKHVGNQIKITFDTFDCYEQDDNYSTIIFNIGGRKISKKLIINLN